jgi:hypothetical protein
MIAMATVVAVLELALMPAAGQAPTPLGGQVAGCPATSAEFHPCALNKAKTFNPRRTPDGQPDLQGIWNAPTAAQSIEAHPGDNGFFFRATKSLIVDPVDGKIPYQAWAGVQSKENEEHYINAYGYCFPSGPHHMYNLRGREIIQRPGSVAVVNEAGGHTFRIIHTDGRPHIGSSVKLWMGDSRGHWEGNTLVVDVTNFNDKTWFDARGHFHSDALHEVERLTLIDADTIHYEATFEDPTVFTRAWTMAFPLVRNKEAGFEQMEEACHEGNDDGKGGDRYNTPLLELGYKPYPGIRPPN